MTLRMEPAAPVPPSAVTFRVYGTPVPQGSMRVYNNRVVASNGPRLRPWRAIITDTAVEQRPEGWDTTGPFHITVVFIMPRPVSHKTAKGVLKATAPHYTATTPDLDKLCRSCLDSLTGVLWDDDKQVVGLEAVKRYQQPGEPPGATITIRRAQ